MSRGREAPFSCLAFFNGADDAAALDIQANGRTTSEEWANVISQFAGRRIDMLGRGDGGTSRAELVAVPVIPWKESEDLHGLITFD